MKNNELISILSRYTDIVLFGINNYGIYLYKLLSKINSEKRILFCDNSKKKIHENSEYPIANVEDAVGNHPQAAFVLMSTIHSEFMEKQLIELGVLLENIFVGVTDEAVQNIEGTEARKKREPLDMLQFEVDIVSHCNLNCKCCSQFSPISDTEFIDVVNMKRDFDRLGELFCGKAKRIYLIGGEPLLHPNLIECMKIAREAFPIGVISVFTNGILLLKQTDEFWKSCRDNNISIIVTKYPIKLEHDKIRKYVESQGVEFKFFGASEDFKYMTNLGLDITGRQNREMSFTRCREANNCIKLRDGKLYTCTRPAAIYKFNKFFNLNLNVCEQDYVDIHAEISGEEVLRKLAKAIPFCRYCNFGGEKKAMEWGRTEKKIEEWL